MLGVSFQSSIIALVLTTSAFAGTIFVNNDEWPLSDAGFSAEGATNGTNLAQNAALFLTGASSGAAIWIDSDNFGLTGSSLQTALGAYTLTDTGTFATFALSDLQSYAAVFLGGDDLTAGEETDLISYVNGGGGVYIAAGTGGITTGGGGAAGEAAQWNAFLNSFSLNLASVYNGFAGNIATNSTSPVLNGVSQIFYDNGNSVNTTGPGAQIITSTQGQGLIGIYPAGTSGVPEPSTIFFVATGLAGLGLFRRKRHQS